MSKYIQRTKTRIALRIHARFNPHWYQRLAARILLKVL
jgi:hypothetical protein